MTKLWPEPASPDSSILFLPLLALVIGNADKQLLGVLDHLPNTEHSFKGLFSASIVSIQQPYPQQVKHSLLALILSGNAGSPDAAVYIVHCSTQGVH